jgi:hypothetical protein
MPLLVDASQANETLYDVFPVERRFNGFAGAFGSRDDANSDEPGAAIDGASVASWHAATIRIDPAKVYETACRSADMKRLPDDKVRWSNSAKDGEVPASAPGE